MRIATLSAACLLAIASFAQSPPENPTSWKVDFVAGPSWLGARSVEMTVAAESLTLSATGKKQRSPKTLHIPMASVQNIIYSRTSFPRSASFEQIFPSGPTAGDPQGEAGLAIVALMLAGITSGMHGQKHFITIEWEEDGVSQQVMVEVPKNASPKLAEELERIAGAKWMNLEQRCSKVGSELMLQRDKSFAIEFDQPVRVAEFHLTAGRYQALLLDRGANSGELYLFAGNFVEQSRLKAIALVQIGPPVSGVQESEVKLDSKTPPGVTEVRTTQTTLKLR
jgi:hypothetical protein